MTPIRRLWLPLTWGMTLTVLLVLGVAWQSGVLAGPTRALEETIRYVAASGTDMGDCQDPLEPCQTPQYAVGQAISGDEIRLAGGVYTGVQSFDDTFPAVVYLSKTLDLRGGYTTTDWTNPQPSLYPTILDAQGKGRLIYIDIPFTFTHVKVEGLHLTGGLIDGPGYPQDPYAGGALFAGNTMLTLRDNHIYGNQGPAGGGIAAWSCQVFLEGNVFEDNLATINGGAIQLDGCGATLSGNRIANNQAAWEGGGLASSGSLTLTLEANQILSNTSQTFGGGLSLELAPRTSLANNMVAGNQATLAGSGLYATQTDGRLIHNTFARNHGGEGSGIHVTDLGPGRESTLRLTNTILVSHTVGLTVSSGNTASLQATLWGAGTWANGTDWAGDGTILTGGSNLWDDPAFLDPGGGNYHLQAGSPAIDQGLNAGVLVDIDGDPRPLYAGFDLGADEYLGPGEPVTGLQAFNDGPTLLGQTTRLSATLTAGTGVSFTWTFGDGASGTGPEVSHTYGMPGSYLAQVVAANAINTLTATTVVTVTTPAYPIFLPLAPRSEPNAIRKTIPHSVDPNLRSMNDRIRQYTGL